VSLSELSISNVRCIEQADLHIPGGLSLVWGHNGSGKTSLLEAIFLLGRGRSFRTRNTDRLVRRNTNHMRVTGQITRALGDLAPIAFELDPEGSAGRVAGHAVRSFAELTEAFPVQVIEPGIHKLVEEGANHRRRWLDWAVFHVEPEFVDHWVRYTRTVKQRNAALRTDASQAASWDPELARLGELISVARRRLMESLGPYWREVASTLTGLEVDLNYHQGWSQEHSLLEALTASRTRDEARQLTHAGPHRADVAIRLGGRVAREVLSRGQQKLVAVAMTLAQIRLLQETTQLTPTLLLDDPAAELDSAHLQRFIEQVARLRCQLVVTSLHADSRLFGTPDSTFHMEQGRVQPV
jgi:DNA replication and repair protein RecF